ncbi:hypothetical protein Cni_G29477 [Canna indica]|uniref:Uncharacterized protein n=1 Tax=Canna indica TaxID=4628 RepID=A0AAQ3LBR4_9LILI|nr:hypothetical protein Cni_G29477 [Canna indica]
MLGRLQGGRHPAAADGVRARIPPSVRRPVAAGAWDVPELPCLAGAQTRADASGAGAASVGSMQQDMRQGHQHMADHLHDVDATLVTHGMAKEVLV